MNSIFFDSDSRLILKGDTVCQTVNSSGTDLVAVEYCEIPPGKSRKIATGVFIELACGVDITVRPRSGLSENSIIATLGTVDCDYRGEIKVNLMNFSDLTFTVMPGDRIAQLVAVPKPGNWSNRKRSERGDGGFGSTGVRNE